MVPPLVRAFPRPANIRTRCRILLVRRLRTRIVRTDAQTLERNDWLILNALSDDYESVEQITSLVRDDWPSAPPLEIIDRLERLYAAGHVLLALEATFNRAEMVREIDQTDDRRFWFGRTPTGDALWQQHATDLGYE